MGVRHHGFPEYRPQLLEGEEGRKGLLAGTEKFTDPQYVAVWDQLARWATCRRLRGTDLPGQNLFTLGQAAIFPAGSWEISLFNQQADFAMGAFPPPLPEGADTCYISDHTDIALGMNAATPNAEAARTFLTWVASDEFAELCSNALPGFYSLSNEPGHRSGPAGRRVRLLARELRRDDPQFLQILSRGEPNLENELWRFCRGDEHYTRPGRCRPADPGRPRQVVHTRRPVKC